MISDTAKFHGSFFVMLLERLNEPISVGKISEFGAGYYLINGQIPVYLKHSSKRKGPWTFNFFRAHQNAQNQLFEAYGECLTCLICGKDGIVGLTMSELRKVLDYNFEEQESISVRRKLKEMYYVKGRDGELESRIGRNFIFEKLHSALRKVQ